MEHLQPDGRRREQRFQGGKLNIWTCALQVGDFLCSEKNPKRLSVSPKLLKVLGC